MRLPLGVALIASATCACAHAPRQPLTTSHVPADYYVVPYPPPPARPQVLPPPKQKSSVWVNGEWAWDGARWTWWRGAWVVPPLGAKLAVWETKYQPSGTLLYAPGTWVLADGFRVPSVWILERKNPRQWATDAAAPCPRGMRAPATKERPPLGDAPDGAIAALRCR